MFEKKEKGRRVIYLLLVVFVLVLAIIACETETEGDERVRTLVETQEELEISGDDVEEKEQTEDTIIAETNTPEPTNTPKPTSTPKPTPTEVKGLIPEGTYIVGKDIDPGIYVGLAGEGLLESCYWARLRNLTGEDDIIANENAEGLYYVEVLQSDKAFETACELIAIEEVPARDEYLKELSAGTYIVGRDIEPGLYQGEAGTDFLDSCYWARLSNVSGKNDILANDNATGKFYIEVLPSDFALKVSCQVIYVEE